MPCIARLGSILIMMFFGDHAPPHIHAVSGKSTAKFRIRDGLMYKGKLPPAQERRVMDWIERHRRELLANWKRVGAGQDPHKISED